MADYIVQGKKGNGKSLICVSRIRDALLERNIVATNLNLYLEHMLPPSCRDVLVYRLPDKPTADDLKMIGRGLPKGQVDEGRYGSIFLDECATILNARTFNDKGRAEFLDYYVHSRKLGWHTYFICQNMIQIDKQVRESLADLIVTCRRLDRVRIPLIGMLSKTFLGFELRPPKAHMATVKYGIGTESMLSDRWIYTGTDLYKAYDTEQVFKDDYDSGVYCYLSPWHLSAVLEAPGVDFVGPIRPGKIDWQITKGRAVEKKKGKHMNKYLGVVLVLGILIGGFGHKYLFKPPKVIAAPGVAELKPVGKTYVENLRGAGLIKNGAVVSVVLSDGRMVLPKSLVSSGTTWEAEIEPNLWVKGGAQ